MRVIAGSLAALAGAAVLVVAANAYGQEAAKKPVQAKAKSACNALTEETACKANETCRWIAAVMDAKTGKQKRKAYCRTQAKSTAKKKP
jgi:hypothetical protein